MIVRTVAYHRNNSSLNGSNTIEEFLYYVTTDLVAEGAIGIMKDGVISCPSQVFTLNKQVRGQFLFQVRNSADEIPPVGGDHSVEGVLMISLEFVKYAK